MISKIHYSYGENMQVSLSEHAVSRSFTELFDYSCRDWYINFHIPVHGRLTP